MSEIHSCSYYCTRSACVRQQRDELRDRLMKQQADPVQPDYWKEEASRYANNAEYWRTLYERANAKQAEPVQRTLATGAESCVPSPSFQMTTQAEPPCDHCSSPLFAAVRCRVCGRKTEWVCPEAPTEKTYQEPGHCDDCGLTLVRKEKDEHTERQTPSFGGSR